MNLKKTKNIKIFAHDAASANVSLAYVLLNYSNEYNIYAYPKGPAVNIFKKEISHLSTIYENIDFNFDSEDIVITGLSNIHSNYEIETIKLARAQGVKVIISILDMVVGIDERFDIGNDNIKDYLPHKILLPTRDRDISSYEEINDILEYCENPYWEYVSKKYYQSAPDITNKIILKYKYKYVVYFTEYIKDKFGNSLGYDEYSLMEDFIDIFKESNIPIFIKLHPSENADKYNKYLLDNNNIIVIKDSIDTQELLYYSKFVFGNMSSVFYEALMLEKEAVNAAIDILQPKSFYKEIHQKIFAAIQELFQRSEPVDILTVTNELKQRGELDIIGGAYYITQLTNRVASAANIEFHARIISQKYIQRELIRISSEIITDAYDETTDVFSLLDKRRNKQFDS